MKRIFVGLIAIVGIIGGLYGYKLFWSPPPSSPPALLLRGDESPLLSFVLRRFTDSSGGIYTNLRDDLPYTENVASNHQMLSESTGLMMQLAIKLGRKDLFELQARFLKEHLLDRSGHVRWLYDKRKGSAIFANSAIDDLLIIRSLFEASKQWNEPEFSDMASRISERLFSSSKGLSVLPDYYNWNTSEAAATVTASYLDLYTLRMLSERNGKWSELYNKSRQLLASAKLRKGLFYKTFDLKANTWMIPAEYNSIDFLYSALHGAEDGFDINETAHFIKASWIRDNKLFSSYSASGEATGLDESPAVYALAYRLLAATGEDAELAESIYRRMKQLSIQDSASELYGGFVSLPDQYAYSFDHLQALLAEMERNLRNEKYKGIKK